MKTVLLWTLVAANAVLAGAFVFRLFPDNAAHAQAAKARPGDYVMIPGTLSGGSTAVVYVLDASTGGLSAISFDEPKNEIRTMSQIDLARVFDAGASLNTNKRK